MPLADMSPARTLTDLLFDKVGDGLCLVAPDGTVVRANAEWLRSTEFAEGQVVGENIIDLFPDMRDTVLAMHARARAGHRIEVPRHAQILNGRETWCGGSIEPVPMEGGTGLLITAREVTDEAVWTAQCLSGLGRAVFPERVEHGTAPLSPIRSNTLPGATERERFLAEVLDNTTTPFAVGSPDGRLLFFNRAFAELTGYGREELQERALSWATDLTPPRWRNQEAEILARAVRDRQSVRYEKEYQRKDGSLVQIELFVQPILAEDGALVHYRSFLTDITARKCSEEALRASEERYRLLFQNMLEGFAYCRMIFGEDGSAADFVYLDVNGAFATHTGLRDVVGKRASEVIPGIWSAHPELLETYCRVARTGCAERFEIDFRPLGTCLAISVYSAQPDHFVAVFDNITERKRAEEGITAAKEHLTKDLDAMMRLHRLSTRSVRSKDLTDVFEEVVEAAISITHADMGNIQVLDPVSRQLKVAAYRNHEQWWLDFFARVQEGPGASCGTALQQGARVIVEDVTTSPVFAGTPALEVQLRAGVRALQSTPLVGGSGNIVGMISTHYRTPRRPDEQELRLLDLLARQVADLIERARDEKALLDSAQRFRALADSMPQLVWTAQPDGHITWFNRRCYEYSGLTPEQMEGWGWQAVHDPTALPEVLRRWKECIATGTALDMEFPLRGGDGKFRRFLSRAFPLKDGDGNVVQWFGTHTDVTDLVDAQEALREAARHKDEFLGMLSHELRNPLAPIRNCMYILQHADAGSEPARRALAVIQRQTDHLTRLVDDLLDVTRIARGKIELRRSRVDLREVVWRAADDFRLAMDGRGVTFRATLPDGKVWADADATRITQVVGNLLHNAAKFTHRGDEVMLSLEAGAREATIRVRDTGAGIDPALLPCIFEAFVQGEHTLARTEGGLGLGLALAKGITDLHGGTIHADSAGKDRGSEFTVRLPLLAALDDDARPKLHAYGGSGGRRVLVVDDNMDAAESLADLVRILGHSVEVAYDGPTGIEKARANPPNVVLCDIGLPGVSGYEVAKALRAEGRTIQLIAVTGYAQPEDVKRAIEAGFDGHVAKPCDLEKIERLLA